MFNLKKLIHKLNIRKKLFIYALLISIIVVPSLFFLSQHIVKSVIIEEYTNYENLSLDLQTDYINSYFSKMEENIRHIYNNETIKNSLDNNFSRSDYYLANIYSELITEQLDEIILNQDQLDNIILIGSNNFSYFYNENSQGHYIDEQFNYQNFKTDFLNTLPQNEIFYYNDSYSAEIDANLQNNFISEVSNLMRNNFVIIREMATEANNQNNILIFSFKNDFLNNLRSSNSNSNIFFYNQETIIWENNIYDVNLKRNNEVINFFEDENENYMQITKELPLHNFNLSTQIKNKYILNEFNKIKKSVFLYMVFFILFIFFISNYFSKIISSPIQKLSEHFSKNKTANNTINLSKFNNISFRKLKVKYKIFLYFTISIIIPILIFSTILFNSYFDIYKNFLEEFAVNNSNLITDNLDRNIKDIDDMSTRVSYSQSVQSLLNSNSDLDDDYLNQTLDKLFTYIKFDYNNLASMNIYNKNQKSLYSSNYYENYSIENIYNDLNNLLADTKGELKFINMDDYSNYPYLVFARQIKSIQAKNFQNIIGYSFFYIDYNLFEKIYRNTAINTDFYFIITDQNGNIITQNKTIGRDFNKNLFLNKIDQSENYFTVNNKDFILIKNKSDFLPLNIATVVPYDYITDKLAPLRKRILLYLLIFTVFLIIISSLISLNMSKRLRNLKDTMKSIAKNKELNLDVLIEDDHNDEISMLANQFNQMIIQINDLIQKNYKAKIKEKELLFLEKEAELNALQQQINPHFLYNTLENIKWLGYKNNDMEICSMITALSDFFRENINHKDNFISLKKELKHLDNYLYIQNKRYKDKFQIVKQITSEAKDTKIPKLILQPLIENSIKHGLEPLEAGGKIFINAKTINNRLRLIVKDTGKGIKKEKLNRLICNIKSEKSNQHFGLKNVYQRISLYYEEFKFEIKSEYNEGTQVLIEIKS